MPGVTAQGISVDRWVKTVMYPRIFLTDQHHDDQGHVGGSKCFQGLRFIGRSAVVEGGSRNFKASWRVDGQLAVDEVLIPFALQHQVILRDIELLDVYEYRSFGDPDHLLITSFRQGVIEDPLDDLAAAPISSTNATAIFPNIRAKDPVTAHMLTLAINTNVQRVIPARCAIHHSWSALSVEVIALCQAVQRT